MIDRIRDLSIKRQTALLGISRGTAYYRAPMATSNSSTCGQSNSSRQDVRIMVCWRC